MVCGTLCAIDISPVRRFWTYVGQAVLFKQCNRFPPGGQTTWDVEYPRLSLLMFPIFIFIFIVQFPSLIAATAIDQKQRIRSPLLFSWSSTHSLDKAGWGDERGSCLPLICACNTLEKGQNEASLATCTPLANTKCIWLRFAYPRISQIDWY